MSLTVLERIQAKVADVLATGLPPLVSGVRVERNRDTQVQHFPTVNVLEGALDSGEESDRESTGATSYVLRVPIEMFVQTETSAALGPALNELYGRIVTLLKADRTLGGLAIDLREGASDPEIGRLPNQRPVGARELMIAISFWTAEDDPYAVGPGAA